MTPCSGVFLDCSTCTLWGGMDHMWHRQGDTTGPDTPLFCMIHMMVLWHYMYTHFDGTLQPGVLLQVTGTANLPAVLVLLLFVAAKGACMHVVSHTMCTCAVPLAQELIWCDAVH